MVLTMETTNNYFIIWDDNWADEFDVFGFETIHPKTYDECIIALEHMKENDKHRYSEMQECYFGTNEFMWLSFENFHQKLMGARILTDLQEIILKNLFGHIWGNGKGMTFGDHFIEYLWEYAHENELNVFKDDE